MKCSRIIERLQEIMGQRGDLEVCVARRDVLGRVVEDEEIIEIEVAQWKEFVSYQGGSRTFIYGAFIAEVSYWHES